MFHKVIAIDIDTSKSNREISLLILASKLCFYRCLVFLKQFDILPFCQFSGTKYYIELHLENQLENLCYVGMTWHRWSCLLTVIFTGRYTALI